MTTNQLRFQQTLRQAGDHVHNYLDDDGTAITHDDAVHNTQQLHGQLQIDNDTYHIASILRRQNGFEPGHVGLPSTAGACTRTQSSNTSTSQDDSYNRQRRSTTTLLLETAWLVTWAKSDTKTMSPRPPGLGARCTEAEIATWTPGAKVTDSDRHCLEPEHDLAIFDSPTAWFLIVGLPVLFIVLPSVYCCCVRPSLKKRRKRRSQARRDAEARAANEVIPGMGEMDGRTDG
ncbi:hypothetical protein V2A60_008560 [Cordyceps javanica]